MDRKIGMACALLLGAFVGIMLWGEVLSAPNFTYNPPQKWTSKWETTPAAVPSTLTDPFTANTRAKGTSWGDYASFTNTAATVCFLEVWDQQTSPVLVIKALIPPYDAATPQANNYVINWGGRVFPGGIKWRSCDGVSVIGYMRIMK